MYRGCGTAPKLATPCMVFATSCQDATTVWIAQIPLAFRLAPCGPHKVSIRVEEKATDAPSPASGRDQIRDTESFLIYPLPLSDTCSLLTTEIRKAGSQESRNQVIRRVLSVS